ncbi:hypothetical protein F2Q69_00041494 [Brassica cretica]|uniref:Uncharacterized protein n=1 Tax=Brassica cretica TaxID=69181 RepID=A0A8S9N4Z0_BRACR|nr:hypothetical protein F2Q69_00041494 [Brassica cretica]
MWSIKKEDLVMKERLSKMKLLESLVAKQVLLADYEEALKKKLIDELRVKESRAKKVLQQLGVLRHALVQREIITRLVIISVLSCGNQSVTELGL